MGSTGQRIVTAIPAIGEHCQEVVEIKDTFLNRLPDLDAMSTRVFTRQEIGSGGPAFCCPGGSAMVGKFHDCHGPSR
jgi:hypothetical protein